MLSSGLAAILASAPAPAEDATWHRHSLPASKVVVSVPCSEGEVAFRTMGATEAMLCKSQEMTFILVSGPVPSKLPGPQTISGNFDEMLAGAREDSDPDAVGPTLLTVAGHRAFRVSTKAGKPVALLEVVELSGGGTITLMAKEEPEGAISPKDRGAAVERALRFADSFEAVAP